MTLKRTNKKVLEQREISKLKTDREKREKDPYRDKGYIIDKCQKCHYYEDIHWDFFQVYIDRCGRSNFEQIKKFIDANIYYKGLKLIPDCRKFWEDDRKGPINPYGVNTKGTGI